MISSGDRLRIAGAIAVIVLAPPSACRKVEERRHPNGVPIVRHEYKVDDDGRRIPHGRYEGWYENGRKRIEGRYVDGLLEGEWRSWHPNGQLWGLSYYVKGQPRGTNTLWRPDGSLDWKMVYGDGTGDPVYIAYDAHSVMKWRGQGNVVRGRWAGTSTWFDAGGREITAPMGPNGPLVWPGDGEPISAPARPEE